MRSIALGLIAIALISGQAHAADQDVIAIQTIIGEARGESEMGQIAVGEVIRNRANDKHWYNDETIEEVCLKPWQFSFWNDRDTALRTLARIPGDVWQQCSKSWALSEDSKYTSGANLYCRWDYWPDWRCNGKAKFIKRIGSHVFYKE